MRSRWFVPFVPLAVVAILSSGCGGGGGEPSGGGVASDSLAMVDNAFEPGRWKVAEGQTYTLENRGRALHNLTISEADLDVDVEPGQTQSVEIDLDPGQYEMVCKFHIAQGMTGTVIVGG